MNIPLQALVGALKKYGSKMDSSRKWMYIAACVKTRNSAQCRDRWLNRLNPDIIFDYWTSADDEKMYNYLVQYNNNRQLLGDKAPNKCKSDNS